MTSLLQVCTAEKAAVTSESQTDIKVYLLCIHDHGRTRAFNGRLPACKSFDMTHIQWIVLKNDVFGIPNATFLWYGAIRSNEDLPANAIQ